MDNLIVKICLPILLLCTIHAASSVQSSPSESSLSSGMRVLLNSYSACRNDNEMINCLKYKFLRLADRMLNTSRISMYDGISLVTKPGSRAFSFHQDEASIFDNRLDEDARESRIDSLLWQRLGSLVNTKSVQFDMPKILEKSAQLIGLGGGNENAEDVDGGRGKKEKKKKGYILIAAVMMKGFIVALMFKALAVLAGSALVVSKIALALASLIALKKLFSQPAPEKTTYEIVKTPVVTHSHEYSHHGYSGGDEHSNSYGRSLEKEEFERRRIQAKRSPPKYEKFESTPFVEQSTSGKLPFFYINEADIANDDSDSGNIVDQDYTNANQGYPVNSNHVVEVDEPTYENDRNSQRWSPKLSETIEPIRADKRYGYRSARVVNMENAENMENTSGASESEAVKSEPSAAQINAIYRSMRGSKAMSDSGDSSSKVEASENSSTKVASADSSAAKFESSSTSDVERSQTDTSKLKGRRTSRMSKTQEMKSER